MRRALTLLVLLSVPLSACGGDDDTTTSATSSSTTTAAETTTTGVASLVLGDPVALGEGTLVGTHPSAPIAYVSIVDRETDQVGCEGGDVARLWAQPLDGGTPVRALPDSFLSGLVLDGGAGGTVAVVDQCEGFLSTLAVARPQDDGTFADLREVDTSAVEASGQLMPSTIRWAADGRSFTGLVHDLAGDGVRAVRVGMDGEVTTLVDGAPLLAVEELADGTLVIATEHSVRIGEDPPIALEVTSIALDPERVRVAVFGPGGTTVLRPDIAPLDVDPGVSTMGSWSADGALLAYLRLDGDEASVWTTTSAGDVEPVRVDDRGGFGAPLFTADGGFVLYNDAVDDPQGYPVARATARAIT